MISVEDAQTRIVAAFGPAASENVALAALSGRVAAADICATTDQPPFAVSAMDGYAVRQADGDASRQLIGAAPAGHPFSGQVGPNQTVRIFTGSVMPEGADAVVIQEKVDLIEGGIKFDAAAIRPDFIRPAGLDFRRGDILVPAGKRITPRDMALLAAADFASVAVRRRPRVAFASIGDELSLPGTPRRPGGIVASTGFGLAAMITAWGGEAIDLGILPDSTAQIATIADADADVVVTLGGASVGDHDLVQQALGARNFKLDFWKVAMRPGRPLIFGRLGTRPLIGMPGNPVSALVCALLFLKPAIEKMLALAPSNVTAQAHLQGDLPASDTRRSYLRAQLSRTGETLWASPLGHQDSAMLATLAKADALIVVPPNAPALKHGALVEIIPLDGF